MEAAEQSPSGEVAEVDAQQMIHPASCPPPLPRLPHPRLPRAIDVLCPAWQRQVKQSLLPQSEKAPTNEAIHGSARHQLHLAQIPDRLMARSDLAKPEVFFVFLDPPASLDFELFALTVVVSPELAPTAACLFPLLLLFSPASFFLLLFSDPLFFPLLSPPSQSQAPQSLSSQERSALVQPEAKVLSSVGVHQLEHRSVERQ